MISIITTIENGLGKEIFTSEYLKMIVYLVKEITSDIKKYATRKFFSTWKFFTVATYS